MSRRKITLGKKTVTLVIFIGALLGVFVRAASAQSATRVLRDIQYFTGPGAHPRFHTLDLYLPEGQSKFPLVFYIHGGAWRGGDKSQRGRVNFFNLFTSRGIGVASVNYRLSPTVQHPAHIEDVARAFAWVYQNAGDYGVDPNEIFLAGHSAGGHLVSLLALDPQYLKGQGLSPDRIRGVMTSSGVYDLVNTYDLGVKPHPREQAFGTDRETQREASSSLKVETAGPATPPFLITYVTNDLFGLAEQAKTFYGLLLNHGLPAHLVKVPARTHLNVISSIGRRITVSDTGGTNTPIIEVEDLLGPALIRFVRRVRDGSFSRDFHAVWPEGGPRAVPRLPSPDLKVIKDVPYYDGPGADPKLNALDLYLPEGKNNFPLLFHVHGGRWRVGNKETPELDVAVGVLSRLGWGIVSTNYRLSPAVKHPTHIQDVARAFAWVYKNASRYGIDRDRIVINGHSAGGHLVSLLALDTSYLEAEGVPSGVIKGVISTSGIYDL
ncbi:alpha/beta hydrolase, partial [Acidobacteria bacterium AH-259-D05]|nr:alpha/beta hydrolase [Acidobacteria bacterium AH-259-D05]